MCLVPKFIPWCLLVVGGDQLLSEQQLRESLLDSDSGSENSVGDYAVIDMLVNNDYNEEVESGVSNRDLKWKDTSNYKGQRELFIVGFGLHSAAKYMEDTWKIFNYFSLQNLWAKCYAEQSWIHG
jgi:hypothetical protein